MSPLGGHMWAAGGPGAEVRVAQGVGVQPPLGFSPCMERRSGRNNAQTGEEVLKSLREIVVYKINGCLWICK